MDIFLTGGTGFIGSAIVPVALRHGHTVRALARSEAAAAALREAGATPIPIRTPETARPATAQVWSALDTATSCRRAHRPCHDFATHRLPLADAAEAYKIFQKKQDGAIKIMLCP